MNIRAHKSNVALTCVLAIVLPILSADALRLQAAEGANKLGIDPSAYLLSNITLPDPVAHIPKILHQTTELLAECVPDLTGGFRDGFEHSITNDEQSREFLERYFTKSVSDAFDKLHGPHRADLYRYAKLYVSGGVYVDIKLIPTMNLDSIFKTNSDTTKKTWYSTTSWRGGIRVFNGFMASPPRNPHFLKMIGYIVENAPPADYQQYCEADAKFLDSQFNIGKSDTEPNEMKSGTFETEDWRLVLMDEDCGDQECQFVSKPDRYGYCCNVYDSDVKADNRRMVAHTRDPDYPQGEKWQQCALKLLQTHRHRHKKHIWDEVVFEEDQWLSSFAASLKSNNINFGSGLAS